MEILPDVVLPTYIIWFGWIRNVVAHMLQGAAFRSSAGSGRLVTLAHVPSKTDTQCNAWIEWLLMRAVALLAAAHVLLLLLGLSQDRLWLRPIEGRPCRLQVSSGQEGFGVPPPVCVL
jgi:hypothetical protein